MNPPEPEPDAPLEEFLASCDEMFNTAPHDSAGADIVDHFIANGELSEQDRKHYEPFLECLRLLEQDRCQGLPETEEIVADHGESVSLVPGEFFDPAQVADSPRYINRFRILRPLGQGGFGVVLLAEDPLLQRLVAIKIPRSGLHGNSDLRKRFLREARMLASLTHQHIVPVFEAGESDGTAYLVTHYCTGGSLASLISQSHASQTQQAANSHPQQIPARGSGLPVSSVVQLMIGLANAVQYAHDCGIIHRDLKPANVLLDTPTHSDAITDSGVMVRPLDNVALHVQISDFGLAKYTLASDREVSARVSETDHFRTTVSNTGIAGTPQYISPEQISRSFGKISSATDVYGLGTIFYEALTGVAAFPPNDPVHLRESICNHQPTSPKRLRSDIPDDIEAICLKCLRKNPADRYRTADELAEDLSAFCRGDEVQARPWSMPERLRRWSRLHRMAATLLLSCCGLLIMLVGLGVWHVYEVDAGNERLQQSLTKIAEQQTITTRALVESEKQATLARALQEQSEVRRLQAEIAERWSRLLHYEGTILRASDLFAAGHVSSASVELQKFHPRTVLDQSPFETESSDVRGFEWHYLWNQAGGQTELRGHEGSVVAIAVTPDRLRGLTVGEDNTLRHWDLLSGAQLKVVRFGIPNELLSAHFSDDATGVVLQHQAEPGQPIQISIWDTNGFQRYSETVRGTHSGLARLSRNGQIMICGGESYTAGAWMKQICSGDSFLTHAVERTDFTLDPPPHTLTDVAFSAAANEFAVIFLFKTDGHWEFQVFAAKPAKPASNDSFELPVERTEFQWRAITSRMPGMGTHLKLSPDGTRLAIGQSMPNAVHVVSWHDGKPVASIQQNAPDVRHLSFRGDNQLLVAGDLPTGTSPGTAGSNPVELESKPTVIEWDLSTGQRKQVEHVPEQLVTAVYSLPEKFDLFALHGGAVIVNKPVAGASQAVLNGHSPHETWGAVFSPEGDRLYSVGDDHCLRVWDVVSQQQIAALQKHSSLVSCVAVSPDGHWVATGSYDRNIILWNAETLSVHAVLSRHTHHIRTIAFTPDSSTLASSGRDGQIRFWDVRSGKEKYATEATGMNIRAIHFLSPTSLIEANANGQIVLHSTRSEPRLIWSGGNEIHCLVALPEDAGEQLHFDTGDRQSVETVAESIAAQILWGEKMGAIRGLVSPDSDAHLVHMIQGQDIRSIAVSPCGRTIAIGSDRQTVHLLSRETGVELLRFSELGAEVNQVAFSADGRRLAAAMHDGKIRIWQTARQDAPASTQEFLSKQHP